MKYLVISDMHGNLENIDKLDPVFKEVEGVFCAGDFAECFKLETGKPVLEKLAVKHEAIFAVGGNCDEMDFIEQLEEQDISVHKSLVFHDGLAIAGSSGGSVFTNETANERTEEDLLSDFEIVENSTEACGDENGKWSNLVIISHNPPKAEKIDSPAPGVHAGSQMLTDFILKRNPVLVVTGHIHEGCAVEKIGETTVVNPGSLAEGKYAIVELVKKDDAFVCESVELKSL